MEDSVEFISVGDGYTSENSQQHTNFKWDDKSTKFYLRTYIERKERFRDPKEKKKLLWKEILQVMRTAGHEVGDEDALDRKMRNLKKTYKTIMFNASQSGKGREVISWKYFPIMDDIFACEFPEPPLESESETNSFTPMSSQRKKIMPTKKRSVSIKPITSLAKKKLAIERKKVKAIEDMHETIKRFLQNRRDSDTRDASHIFGEYIAAKHRQYNGRVKSYLEIEVSQILFNADTGRFDA